ncbi:MAG: NTP transferase domain-containing protein [Planctomycetota bacterium]|nr:NTP transferase domain-containing protein [Verrucomicrobiota bacterium]MDI9442970.1 NTP transferase domain-containing protein [Planctomycetota bacterium]
MPAVENAVILAAGAGTRLGMGKPKCLVELAGRMIVDYQLELLRNVPNVHVVVGYQEKAVIDAVRALRADVVFVRNPSYMTRSNFHSLYLGARTFQKPFISLDGDLLMTRAEFDRFLAAGAAAGEDDFLLGVTEAKTDDAVFVHLDDRGDIAKFSRSEKGKYEWTGPIYVGRRARMAEQEAFDGYQFEFLMQFDRLRAFPIHLFEIDTPNDFAYVEKNFRF